MTEDNTWAASCTRAERIGSGAVGFAIAALWSVAGFLVMVGAVVAGLIGFAAVRLLDGRVDVSGLVDKLSTNRH